jgi:2-oxoglutarate ferredoxin oxidoreductase subunit beta
MDNAVYGLTKGQSSPTTELGVITSSTPYGKLEGNINPLDLYLTLGTSFVASSYSSKVKDLAALIELGMNHPGFAIVHVQSPCTTYNDTHEAIRGNPKKEITPLAYDIPEEHDTSDLDAAHKIARRPGVPLGVIYRDPESISINQRVAELEERMAVKSPADLIDAFNI